MDDRIQHFSHPHRLTLRHDAYELCKMCESICEGLSYSCEGCNFVIHKTCAELPHQINHPFHPQHPLTLFTIGNFTEIFQCHACGNFCESLTYNCSQCEFNLAVNCAALMPTKSTTESSGSSHHQECQIDHHVVKLYPHPHPLFLCKTEKITDFFCSGCKLVIENGSIYVCIQCKAILHKSCSQFPQFIKHHFHPNHTLTLLSRPPYRSGQFHCNACGGAHEGFTFHCSECEFDLDINCAFLMPISTTDPKEEHQFDHPHPLIPCKSSSSKTKNKNSFVCGTCGLPFDDDDGSSMFCCLDCRLLLHKSCLELPVEIQHPFHPNHPLKLMTNYEFPSCRACLRDNKGFTYACLEALECDFTLDIPCALSTPLLVNSQLHEHQLAFFSFVGCDLECSICHHRRKKSSLFRCVACDFNVHTYCVPNLPPTASDGNHRHPLTLTKSLVKDYEDEDEDAEFYCDRCENERSLCEPTYYCADCHYVAHVHCVIQEVVRFMEEEWSLAQKLGDKRLAISTDSDSSKENGNELVSRVLIEEEDETTRSLLTNTNLHEHPLTFFRDVVDDLSCIVCNLYSHSNFFRCVPCNFSLHLLCISTLPPTILHKSHRHTLTLTCPQVRAWYIYGIDDGVSHCSACRKERQLSEPMYYCAQCEYAAHLRCALPELAMDVEGSLAHKFGDTKLAISSISSEGITINQMVREVLINFSDFSQRHEDREEAIAAIRVKIEEEKAKIEALRKKYIQEHEFKVDALEKRLEALEKQCT